MSVEILAADMAGLERRLRALAARALLTDAEVIELGTAYSNMGHFLAYAEGNQRHLDFQALLPQADSVFGDTRLEAALLGLLDTASCASTGAERVRLACIDWLRRRRDDAAMSGPSAIHALYQDAARELACVEDDQAALLQRIGVRAGGAPPSVAFYRAVSTADSAATRAKLTQAWNAPRDRRLSSVVAVLDKIALFRGDGALDRTLRRSHLSESQVEGFIDGYLVRALDAAHSLAGEIRRVTGAADRPLDHFGYYARGLVGATPLPAFDLDGCLDLAVAIANEVFGLSLVARQQADPRVAVFDAFRQGRPHGRAHIDLLGPAGAPAAAAVTAPALSDHEAQPAARALCRYHLDADGRRVLTFEAAHSLFHEFGHIVNHLLLERHGPSDSGLDYLPVERLEDLSMWWEKWVYHPRFAAQLGLGAEHEAGVALCGKVKRLEFVRANLDRAVVAALDFDVHRGAAPGLEEGYRALDQRYGLDGLCDFGALPGYFTWPMCRTHPGANFVYLWGGAYGADAFAPWLCGEPTVADDLFRPCFDPDLPTRAPTLDALFAFYDPNA